MTRFMKTTAALALGLAIGTGAATAQDQEQLRLQAESILNDYGFENVDTSMLTTEQLVQFQTLNDLEDRSRADATTRIDGILVDNPDTMAYVSRETADMFADPQGDLISHAEDLFQEYNVDADANAMSVEQLAQLWFLDTDDKSRAMIEDEVQAIATGS